MAEQDTFVLGIRVLRQRGFTHLLTLVILFLILAVVGGTGYYVWQSEKRAASDHSQSVSNSSAYLCPNQNNTNLDGMLFSSSDEKYSLCIPDGWKVIDNKLPAPGTGNSLFAEAGDLVYKPGTAPVLDKNVAGISDKTFAFTVFYDAPNTLPPSDFTASGSVTSVNVSGTKYTKTVASVDPKAENVPGTMPKGTVQTEYYFEKNGANVRINYNRFPGTVDESTLIDKVAHTVSMHTKDNGIRTVTYSSVPAGLQQAILTTYTKYTPACVVNNRIVDRTGKPYETEVVYAKNGYALTYLGCGAEGQLLYALSGSVWQLIEGPTDFGYQCSIIDKYKVPAALLEPPECLLPNGSTKQL